MTTRVKLFGKLLAAAHILGILPKEEYFQPGSGLIRILYGAYQLWPILFLIPLLLSQMAAIYRYWGDTVLVLDIVCLMDGICMGLLVNVWLFFASRELRKLLEYLEAESVFTSHLVQQNPKLKQLFEKGQRKCILFSRAIGCSMCSAIFFLFLAPLAIRYFELEEEICQNAGNRSLTPRALFHQDGYHQFSIPMWLAADSTRWYYMIWFFQLAVAVGSMRTLVPYSSMMISMFLPVGLQFEIIVGLMDQIRDLPDQENLQISEEQNDIEDIEEEATTVITAENYLKEVIKLHQKALESTEDINSLQKLIIGGCFVLMLIIKIMSMFQMSMNPALTAKYALVLGGSLVHLYAFFSVGDYISEQSERIGYAAYETNWYERSRNFKRLILIMMARCQKPCVWTVVMIIEIKLSNFVDVCSACYRVFMILLQLGKSSMSEIDCSE